MGLNWASAVKEAGDITDFEDVPKGEYTVMAETTEIKTAPADSDKDWKGINVMYRIQSGKFSGRVLFKMFFLPPEEGAEQWQFRNFLRDMAPHGLSPEGFFMLEPTNEQIACALEGKTVRVVYGKKKQESKYMEVLKVLPREDGAKEVTALPSPPGPSSEGAVPF